jgi:hypothetical protein
MQALQEALRPDVVRKADFAYHVIDLLELDAQVFGREGDLSLKDRLFRVLGIVEQYMPSMLSKVMIATTHGSHL